MSEPDEFDAQARSLLIVSDFAYWGGFNATVAKVAAALRAQHQRWFALSSQLNKDLAELRAENETLRGEADHFRGCWDAACAERDELKAQIEKQKWINDAVYQGMCKEADELKAQLAEAEKRGMERAIKVNCVWCEDNEPQLDGNDYYHHDRSLVVRCSSTLIRAEVRKCKNNTDG